MLELWDQNGKFSPAEIADSIICSQTGLRKLLSDTLFQDKRPHIKNMRQHRIAGYRGWGT